MPALEFCVAPDDFARLLRLPALGKRGPRASVCDRVWYDTADASLAAAGTSLSQQGRTWRLEAAQPTHGQPWPPGTPPPLLAEADSLEQLAQARALPQPLVPLAGFHGRQRTIPFTGVDGGGQLVLLEGTLRGVTQERAVGRVILEGTASSLLAMSDQAAAAVTLSVPRWSLAVEAIALARGQQPAPRRTGAPAVPADTSLDDAIALVLGHLVDVILAAATTVAARSATDGHSAEPVHQLRVAARRLRSALSVFKRAAPDAAFDPVNQAVRHLATMAGHARDWDVFLEGTGAAVAAAFPEDARIEAMLAAGGRHRTKAYAGLIGYLASPVFRELELSLVQLTALRGWAAVDDPDQAARLREDVSVYATHALGRFLDQMLEPGADIAELPVEALHDIRKQGKRLRYACEFFAPLYGRRSARKFIERLSVLQEALGHLNDSASAGSLMAAMGATGARQFAAGAVMGFVAAQGGAVRGDISHAWHKLRRQEPFWT